jgi:hypothetical protein
MSEMKNEKREGEGRARQAARDLAPAVAELPVGRHERRLLGVRPAAALDVRLQVVVPALAALRSHFCCFCAL